MNINIIDLIRNMIVNFLDCVITYFLCNNLIEKKAKISTKMVFIGITYGIVLGTLGLLLDGYLIRAILMVILIIFVKLLSRKRFPEVSIIYAIIFLFMVVTQAPSLLLISSLGPGINEGVTHLLTQIMATVIILFICAKVPLYNVFNKIERELLLKLLIFSLTGIIVSILFYNNFQYTTSYVIYLTLVILVVLIGLYQTLKIIFFYTNKVPMQLHDIKNTLMGMYISLYNTSDISEARKEMDKVLDIIGIDISMEEVDINDYHQNILSFINQKKVNNAKKELPLICNIGYYEHNEKVSFSVVLYMLGVLLDNAIESGTKKAIIIDISVIEESLYISVANEYKRKSGDDFIKMFQEKYSTKGEGHSRGYGLSNLSKVVSNYKGEISLKEECNIEQNCNYLIIAINISA